MVRRKPNQTLDLNKYRELKNRSIFHECLRQYVSFFHNNLWHKKVHFVNKHNIPKNQPIIFAANHQNALLDAFAMGLNSPHQMVYVARADIFKNPTVATILRALKIMPIFRPRDGVENMETNKDTFILAAEILQSFRPFGILPEGNHDKHRRLRPLKKGIARIAFMAGESSNFDPGILIVPVGVDYTEYIKPQGELTVTFGEPLKVNDYKELYLENAGKAVNKLRDDLFLEMKKLVIHIESEEYYDCINALRNIASNEFKDKREFTRPEIVKFQRELVKKFEHFIADQPEAMSKLATQTGEYMNMLQKLDLRDWVVKQQDFNTLTLIVETLFLVLLLPVHLFGVIFNYFPYKLIDNAGEKIKDTQFRSSVKLGMAVVLFPVYYIIVHNLSKIVLEPNYYAWLFTPIVIISGLFAFKYWLSFKKLRSKIKMSRLKVTDYQTFSKITSLRNKLISTISKVNGINI